MKREHHLVLRIETEGPIELASFVGAFVGLGNQYERFSLEEHPKAGSARFYVEEVRAGAIVATLVPYLPFAMPALGVAMAGVKHANDLVKFVENFGGRLKKYFKPGGREPEAIKSDLGDYLKTVQAIAEDNNGTLSMAAYDDGQQRVIFEFSTKEAREAERQLADHQRELESTTNADYTRVLMVFVKTDKRSAKPGKRSGEAVVIEAISPKALPIVYASNLAEQQIKHEIAEGAENIYKRGFDVNVNVEMRHGQAVAYRIQAVHSIIDLPDEG